MKLGKEASKKKRRKKIEVRNSKRGGENIRE